MNTPKHRRTHAVLKRPIADPPAQDQLAHVEEVEIRGHIIDSLILPKVLDLITAGGGSFRIKQIAIGQARTIRATRDRGPRRPTARRWPRFWRRSPITAPCRRAAGLPAGGGRHRRRISRRLLQHHEPADRGPHRRPVDRGGRPGDGLRHRRRRPPVRPAVPGDDRREAPADRSSSATPACACSHRSGPSSSRRSSS